jgi:hypothetical protein
MEGGGATGEGEELVFFAATELMRGGFLRRAEESLEGIISFFR